MYLIIFQKIGFDSFPKCCRSDWLFNEFLIVLLHFIIMELFLFNKLWLCQQVNNRVVSLSLNIAFLSTSLRISSWYFFSRVVLRSLWNIYDKAFCKIAKGLYPLTTSAKYFLIDNWQFFKYPSVVFYFLTLQIYNKKKQDMWNTA